MPGEISKVINNIGQKFYMWQKGMCITYLVKFRQMEQFLIKNGYIPTEDIYDADMVVVGACASFLPYFDAYKERVSMISSQQTLVVYGCIPIVDKKFFKDTTPNIALFIPPKSPERIAEIISHPKVAWEDIAVSSIFRKADYSQCDPGKRFIVIQEGCNEKCIHCPHRVAIGEEKSYLMEEIISQIKRDLSENKPHTFLLEGENSGAWGQDLTPPMTYAHLLKEVLAVSGSTDIHLSNISPKWFLHYGELFMHPRITNIKVPIQTVSSRLLSLMGRDPCVYETAPLLKKLRKVNDKLVLRTEIIIGYPTSTYAELTDTLEFVSEYFHKVACFSFDYHPHTEIARKRLPLLSEAVMKDHVQKAMSFFSSKHSIEAVFDDRGKICNELITGGLGLTK